MRQILRTLVVAKDGPFRDSLVSLLATIPGVIASAVDSVILAGPQLRRLQPALLVIDADPDDAHLWTLLRAGEMQTPVAKYVLMVESAEEQQSALAAGASVVLLKGFPAQALTSIVRELLRSNGADHPVRS